MFTTATESNKFQNKQSQILQLINVGLANHNQQDQLLDKTEFIANSRHTPTKTSLIYFLVLNSYFSQFNRDSAKLPYLQCFNRYCSRRHTILKTVVSKGWLGHQYIHLCEECQINHKQNNYCQYCEQIFNSNQDSNDEKEWIQCEKCVNWNHIDCEARFWNNKIYEEKDKPYFCCTCRSDRLLKKQEKKKFMGISRLIKNDDPFVYETNFIRKNNRKPIQAIELDQVPRKINKIKLPESSSKTLIVSKDNKVFLSIKLSLTEEEIKKDLEELRQSAIEMKVQYESGLEEKTESKEELSTIDGIETENPPKQPSKSKKPSPQSGDVTYMTRFQQLKTSPSQKSEGVRTRKRNKQRL